MPEIVVTNLAKEITCGDSHVTLHEGKTAFVRLSSVELPVGEIGNLIAALQTAQAIAHERRSEAG